MINWLASYPKSGNTWVRLFLDAYILDQEPNINKIVSTRGDQVVKNYNINGFDILKYPLEHQPLARGMMLLRMNDIYECGFENDEDKMHLPFIMKTHMANVIVNGIEMIPKGLTNKIVYLVRDPRKVAISYAKHMNISVSQTVDILIDDHQASFDLDSTDRLPHHMSSWFLNAYSYMTAKDLEVYAVKYEDILKEPEINFKFILDAFEVEYDEERMIRAIDRCSLDNLRKQEKESGFRERPKDKYNFFGDTKQLELTKEDEEKLIKKCAPMMEELGYI